MNPEVFYQINQASMALLSEYDLAASEIPYSITLSGPLTVTIRELKDHPLLIWELADAAIMGFARTLQDDEFHDIRATCFFEGGHAIVPVQVTRANGKAFSLMDAFFEMILDRSSPAKI